MKKSATLILIILVGLGLCISNNDGRLPVFFAEQNTVNVVSGTLTPQNKLDVKGSSVVGNSCAWISTAPLNGMIVEGLAGIFSGNVQVSGDINVTGKLTKGSGSFEIDHRRKNQRKPFCDSNG